MRSKLSQDKLRWGFGRVSYGWGKESLKLVTASSSSVLPMAVWIKPAVGQDTTVTPRVKDE